MHTPTIWIINAWTQEGTAIQAIKEAEVVYLRERQAEKWVLSLGAGHPILIQFPATLPEKQPFLEKEFKRVRNTLGEGKSVVVVTSASPLVVDTFARELCGAFKNEDIRWSAGVDVTASEVARLSGQAGSLVSAEGNQLADCYHWPFDPTAAVCLYHPCEVVDAAKLVDLLQAVFPPTLSMSIACYLDSGQVEWSTVLLKDLVLFKKEISILLVPPRSPDSSLTSFEEVIAHLRAPNGCPWDRKQTHESLRQYLLEETYEALDALDQKDWQGLCEELGDLVLQIALHAQIGVEKGEFNLEEVVEGINRKIIFRHPHVFGDVSVDGVSGVLQNWEKLKQKEREEKGKAAEKGILDGIPQSFPALAQAQVIQTRAATVGFDWKEIDPVLAKVLEELEEVKTAPNEEERAKELGDLLFAVVNLVRWYKVDAESALRGTNQKFRRRFAYIEQKSRESGKPMQEMSLEEMDVYWDEAKKTE